MDDNKSEIKKNGYWTPQHESNSLTITKESILKRIGNWLTIIGLILFGIFVLTSFFCPFFVCLQIWWYALWGSLLLIPGGIIVLTSDFRKYLKLSHSQSLDNGKGLSGVLKFKHIVIIIVLLTMFIWAGVAYNTISHFDNRSLLEISNDRSGF